MCTLSREVAQYPLELGRGAGSRSSKIVPMQVDKEGKVLRLR